MSQKYDIPLKICQLTIDAEFNDENVPEEVRVDRARFILRVLNLFDRIQNAN